MPSEDAVLRTTTTSCKKRYVKSLDASAVFRAVAIMSHAKGVGEGGWNVDNEGDSVEE